MMDIKQKTIKNRNIINLRSPYKKKRKKLRRSKTRVHKNQRLNYEIIKQKRLLFHNKRYKRVILNKYQLQIQMLKNKAMR